MNEETNAEFLARLIRETERDLIIEKGESVSLITQAALRGRRDTLLEVQANLNPEGGNASEFSGGITDLSLPVEED